VTGSPATRCRGSACSALKPGEPPATKGRNQRAEILDKQQTFVSDRKTTPRELAP